MTKIKIDDKYKKAIFVAILFIIYFVWSMQQPYNCGPDEYMKFDIVKYIVENNKLPHGGDESIRNPIWGISYGFSPILAYIISAIFIKITFIFTGTQALTFAPSQMNFLIAARMVCVFSNIGTAIVCFKIAKELFKEKYKWLFMFLLMFLPQFVYLATYLNTDSFAVFTIALIIYAWILGLKNGWNKKECIILGIGIGLCFLSYFNAYTYILCSVIIYIASYFIKEKDEKIDWKKFFISGIIIASIALAISSWWFIRNAIIYDGDFLGLATQNEYAEKYAEKGYKPSDLPTPLHNNLSLKYMLIDMQWIKISLKSFIGVYGGMDIVIPTIMYRSVFAIWCIALVGFLLNVKDLFKKENRKKLLLIIIMIIAIVITIGLSMYYSYASDFQPQGRYLMPMLIPFMYFVTKGIENILERFIKNEKIKNIVIILLSLFMVFLVMYSLIFIIMPFYD